MSFFNGLRYRLQRFMVGRNGVDLLSRDLNILGLAFMLADLFLRSYVLYFVGLACFLISLLRSLSRSTTKRSAENVWYFNKRSQVKKWFAAKRQEFSDRKVYRYFRCAGCSQRFRVPKGRGRIEITCPKCSRRVIKKT